MRHNLVGRVIGEGDQVNARLRGEMAKDVVTADLVTAIGWIGRAMREEQDVHQPSPRAIHGPATFAIGRGSRCHARTISAYFGLSGLTARAAPACRVA